MSQRKYDSTLKTDLLSILRGILHKNKQRGRTVFKMICFTKIAVHPYVR